MSLDSRLDRRWALGLALLATAVGARCVVLIRQPRLDRDLQRVQAVAERQLSAAFNGEPWNIAPLKTLGVERILWQYFDPTALVLIRPGADGQPGVAGVDDNGNAIVDDRTELGATRSDDVCRVETQSQYRTSPEDALVLQRGAHVTAARLPAQLNAKTQPPPRAIVIGKNWEFRVEAP